MPPTRRRLHDRDPFDDLFTLRAVGRVAETGSFSAAARALGVTVSTITRAVQRTEARLGTGLFLRSTHGIAPTEAGRAYGAHVSRWLAEDEALRLELSAVGGAARGTLRVTVPVFVAQEILPDVVSRFLERHPQVRLDVHASDDYRDLVKEAFDLGIRMGPLPDSTLRMRRVGTFRRLLCAAPGFMTEHGTLKDPRALAGLPCLLYGGGGTPIRWRFRTARGQTRDVAVSGPVRSNNLGLLLALAEQGQGVARLPDWAAREALARGSLLELLPAWSHARDDGSGALFALHPRDPGKDRLRQAFLLAFEEVTSVS